MRRVLVFLVVFFLSFVSLSTSFSAVPSQWEFRYRADNATYTWNNNEIEVYVENGVAYLSTSISDLGKLIKEGMRFTVNISAKISPVSVSSGIKIILGNDTLVHKSLSTGSYVFQFYTLHSYNITEKFMIVLYDYGGNMRVIIDGLHIENPRGGVNEGLFLSGIGISVVFIVLSILAVVMYGLKPTVERKKKSDERISEEKAKAVEKEVGSMEIEVDEEIVAAITGALSLYLGGKRFKIISVKPSNWKYYGRFRSMR